MYEQFEDTKVVIRTRKLRRGRQYNGQKKKVKMSNNDLQNSTAVGRIWIKWGKGVWGDILPSGGLGVKPPLSIRGPGANLPKADAFL
jgi:hypothetical protein